MHRVRKLPRNISSVLFRSNLIFWSFIGLVTIATCLFIFWPGQTPIVDASCANYFPKSDSGGNIGYFNCSDRANGGDDVLDSAPGGWSPAPSDSTTYLTCSEPNLATLNSTICPKTYTTTDHNFAASGTSFSEQIGNDASTFCTDYEEYFKEGTLGNHLSATAIQNGVGAWFIIQKMDVKDPPISTNYCQGDYATEISQWKNDITSEFNGNTTIDYNYCPDKTTTPTSEYVPGTDDYTYTDEANWATTATKNSTSGTTYYPTDDTSCQYSYMANTYSAIGSSSGINDIFEYGGKDTGSGTVPAIAIWYYGTPTSSAPDFIIKYVCGNPVGQLNSHVQHELDVDFQCVDEYIDAANYKGYYQGLIVTINNGIESTNKIYLGTNSTGPLIITNSTNHITVTDVINPPPSNGYGDWTARNFTVVSDPADPSANIIRTTYPEGPCAKISCGTTNFQGIVQAGLSYRIWATANVSDVSSNPSVAARNSPFNIKVTSSLGSTTTYSTAPPPATATFSYSGGNPGDAKATANNSFTVSSNAAYYTVSWEWTVPVPANAQSNTTTGYSCSRIATVVIPQLPYFDVYAGDIEAGLNYGSCSTSSANISSNNNTIGSPPDVGASGQLAAITPGDIEQFYSFYYNNSSPSPGGSGLTFSNDPLSALGGGFPSCTTDYYSAASQIPSTGYTPFNISGSSLAASIPGAPSSPTTYLANYSNSHVPLNISDVNIPLNENVIVLVSSANVYIYGSTPVSYPANFGSIKAIPSLEVITQGGDIFIDSSVSSLNGSYVAETDSSNNGGVIDTCTTTNPPAVPLDYASFSASDISACQRQLIVNGAVSASSTILGRTIGDINNDTAKFGPSAVREPAETFQYNPEVWLPYLFYNSGGAHPPQSLNKLPPTL